MQVKRVKNFMGVLFAAIMVMASVTSFAHDGSKLIDQIKSHKISVQASGSDPVLDMLVNDLKKIIEEQAGDQEFIKKALYESGNGKVQKAAWRALASKDEKIKALTSPLVHNDVKNYAMFGSDYACDRGGPFVADVILSLNGGQQYSHTNAIISAMKCIYDDGVLKKIAKADIPDDIRFAAIRKIDDELTVFYLFKESSDKSIRFVCLEKLNRRGYLDEIVGGDYDPMFKVAAFKKMSSDYRSFDYYQSLRRNYSKFDDKKYDYLVSELVGFISERDLIKDIMDKDPSSVVKVKAAFKYYDVSSGDLDALLNKLPDDQLYDDLLVYCDGDERKTKLVNDKFGGNMMMYFIGAGVVLVVGLIVASAAKKKPATGGAKTPSEAPGSSSVAKKAIVAASEKAASSPSPAEPVPPSRPRKQQKTEKTADKIGRSEREIIIVKSIFKKHKLVFLIKEELEKNGFNKFYTSGDGTVTTAEGKFGFISFFMMGSESNQFIYRPHDSSLADINWKRDEQKENSAHSDKKQIKDHAENQFDEIGAGKDDNKQEKPGITEEQAPTEIDEIIAALKITEAKTPLELGIKSGAATECIRGKKFAINERQHILDEFGAIPAAEDWDLAAKMLDKLADLLSRATKNEMSMAQEASALVGDGSRLTEVREFACRKVELFGEYLEEPGAPSIDPITFKAKKAINAGS